MAAYVRSPFDAGLDAEGEDRAARLHDESVIVDLMLQGPCGPRAFDDDMLRAVDAAPGTDVTARYLAAVAAPVLAAVEGRSTELESCWRASGVTAGNREIDNWTPDLLGQFALAQVQFDRLPWLLKACRSDDVRRAKRAGCHAGYVSTQDTVHFGRDLDLVAAAHGLGLRMMQLTYNSLNFVGAGCTERTDAGLSAFGRRLVELMGELGIVVDVSHCGRQTTLDACEFAGTPVVASHTSAAGLHAVDRAKSDDELRAIAGTGGVVGVYAVPFFLADKPQVTLADMLDHVCYVADLVGVEHVGIGTDWPLQLPHEVHEQVVEELAAAVGFRREHKLDAHATVGGFEDYRDFPNITRGLVARGFSDDEVRAILGENALRVFAAVWDGGRA